MVSGDGLVISSPEYAHGIAGSIKNALDWLVSKVEFPGKAFSLINSSLRAERAQAQLREVLKTVPGEVVEEGHTYIGFHPGLCLGKPVKKLSFLTDLRLRCLSLRPTARQGRSTPYRRQSAPSRTRGGVNSRH